MSYAQAMKWQRKHPRGGAIQPVLMSTGSGFWPSGSFLREDFWPYVERCAARGEEPIGCEEYYRLMLKGDAPA